MRSQDYSRLNFQERFAVLRCLFDLALASDSLRDHVSARLEAYTAPKGRVEQPNKRKSGAGSAADSAAEQSIGAKMVEQWVTWTEQQRWVHLVHNRQQTSHMIFQYQVVTRTNPAMPLPYLQIA